MADPSGQKKRNRDQQLRASADDPERNRHPRCHRVHSIGEALERRCWSSTGYISREKTATPGADESLDYLDQSMQTYTIYSTLSASFYLVLSFVMRRFQVPLSEQKNSPFSLRCHSLSEAHHRQDATSPARPGGSITYTAMESALWD